MSNASWGISVPRVRPVATKAPVPSQKPAEKKSLAVLETEFFLSDTLAKINDPREIIAACDKKIAEMNWRFLLRHGRPAPKKVYTEDDWHTPIFVPPTRVMFSDEVDEIPDEPIVKSYVPPALRR